MSKVYQTEDYSQFKDFETNRSLTKIDKLCESIEKRNMLEFHPIHVDKDMHIIDGQHRLACAKKLGIPIYYIIDDEGTEHDIPSLNSTSKLWSLQNFTDHYSKLGKEAYLFVNKIINKYKIYPNVIIKHSFKIIGKQSVESLFKKGEATFKRLPSLLEKDFENCYEIMQISKKLGINIHNNACLFLLNYISLNDYDHEFLIKRIYTYADNFRNIFIYRSFENISKQFSEFITKNLQDKNFKKDSLMKKLSK